MQILRIFWILLLVQACGVALARPSENHSMRTNGLGPGDRPSICLKRSLTHISPNLSAMTKLADALRTQNEVDEVGLSPSADGSAKLTMLRAGSMIKPSEKMRAKFAPLFDDLIPNFFAPWVFFQRDSYVLARPGNYFPGLIISNSGPWCGGSDDEWRAELEKEVWSGVNRGGPILYKYYPDGVVLNNPCSDEAFLTEEYGRCELRLDQNWAMVFTYMNRSVDEVNKE